MRLTNGGEAQAAFFASTPPLEAKKVLFSRLAQERTRKGENLRLSFLDVKKAYLNGIPKRDVYMSLPREMGLPSHLVAKQVRCVYGTRDAGQFGKTPTAKLLKALASRLELPHLVASIKSSAESQLSYMATTSQALDSMLISTGCKPDYPRALN